MPIHDFDAVADKLVEDKRLVSYSSLRERLKDRDGHSVSDRDLKTPFADWRERRGYKGHLALLDLPEEMEKAIASFADMAMKIAEARAQAALPIIAGQVTTTNLLEQMQRIVSGLERQLASLSEENRTLRDQIAELLPPPEAQAAEEEAQLNRSTIIKPRKKSGAENIAATAFWDRVMSDLSDRLLALGRPMSVDDLLLEVPESTKDFAALAFQPLDSKALRNKLRQRIVGKKHGFAVADGGLFRVRPSMDRDPEAGNVAASR